MEQPPTVPRPDKDLGGLRIPISKVLHVVTGEWRKLHEELHNLYSSPDIIRQIKPRRMRWAVRVARMGDERKLYKVLVEKSEEKRPLGRPRRGWEDGIRTDLKEIDGEGVDSVG
jgi:hypothetical protein